MPYIKSERRASYDRTIHELVDRLIIAGRVGGDANYVITRILLGTFRPVDGWRYHAIEQVRGILNGVLDEFNRRIAGPYEDLAIENNGDVKEYWELKNE